MNLIPMILLCEPFKLLPSLITGCINSYDRVSHLRASNSIINFQENKKLRKKLKTTALPIIEIITEGSRKTYFVSHIPVVVT